MAHVEYGEATACAGGEECVLNEIRVVQTVVISNPEFGDYVLTQSIGHFPRRSSINRRLRASHPEALRTLREWLHTTAGASQPIPPPAIESRILEL